MGKGTTSTTTEKFTASVTFNVTDYGPAVLVEICPKGKFCSIRNDTIVFDGSTFRRLQKQRGGKTSWVLCTKEHACRVVTPEYYACYVSGGLPRSTKFNEASKRLAKDPRAALENGDFHLAIRDNHSYDHNFYDLNGRAVPRPIRMDYIYGRLHGSQSALEIIAEKLRAHDQVSEVVVSMVPCPVDSGEHYGIEYLFAPTPRQFAQWGPGSKGYDYNAAYARIRKLVGCGAKEYGMSHVVASDSTGKVVVVDDND